MTLRQALTRAAARAVVLFLLAAVPIVAWYVSVSFGEWGRMGPGP